MAYQLYLDLNDVGVMEKGEVLVQSQSNPKVFYKVDQDAETCSCPAYTFSMRDPKCCKHLKSLGLKGKQSPVKPTGILGEDYL